MLPKPRNEYGLLIPSSSSQGVFFSGVLDKYKGIELSRDARTMSVPISSDYQIVPRNNFDQTIKTFVKPKLSV